MRYPSLYQVNTRVYLTELGRRLGVPLRSHLSKAALEFGQFGHGTEIHDTEPSN